LLAAIAAVTVAVFVAVPAVAARASSAPDLSMTVRGPRAVGINSPFSEKVTVTNRGTAAAPGIAVGYSTGGPGITPSPAPGMYCTYIQRGHSSRGGGYTTVGESCSETLAGGLAPGHRTKVVLTMTEQSARKLILTFAATTYPVAAQLDLVSHTAAVAVSVIRPPAAAAPTRVRAIQSGDQLNVTWKPAPTTARYISSSRITATPVGGSTTPVLTGSASGTARKDEVIGVMASTRYAITVANDDGGGAGATSRPFRIKTARATISPGAPAITYMWGYADVRWSAPSAGNSAIDRYEVLATGGGQTIKSYVSGSTLADYLSPQPADSLAVKVRAHNAAGWGRWSAAVYFSDGG
jgi:hypothetical protein